MKDTKEKFRLFEFNDQEEEFQEIEIKDDIPLYEYLDPKIALLFVDPQHNKYWLWFGRNSFRMQNTASKMVHSIMDKLDVPYKIRIISQDNEPDSLKEILGLKFEIGLEVPNYDFIPELLDREFKKIESLIKENPDDELVIERKYLPETIDGDLLEISKNDKHPTLIQLALSEFKKRGVMTEFYNGKVKFVLVVKKVEEILNKRIIQEEKKRFGKLTSDYLQSLIHGRNVIKRSFLEIGIRFGGVGVNYLKEELNRVQKLIDEEVGNPIKITLDKDFRTLKVEKDNKKN